MEANIFLFQLVYNCPYKIVKSIIKLCQTLYENLKTLIFHTHSTAHDRIELNYIFHD